jgi:hypothetical protein
MDANIVKGLRKGEVAKGKQEQKAGTYIRLEGAERDSFRNVLTRLGHDPDDVERGGVKAIGQAIARLGLDAFTKALDADDAERAKDETPKA